MKCYSWSRYWSKGEDSHVFERPNHAGYTFDLNQAGTWDIDENVLSTKEDILKAKSETDNECYYIPVDKVGMLGRIQTTVRN